MTEETNNNDVKDQANVAPEIVTSTKTASETSQQESSVGSKDYNWRKMEDKLARLERDNEEMRKVYAAPAQKVPEPEEDFSSLQTDDLVTFGQVDKLAEKKARTVVKQLLMEQEKQRMPIETKRIYNDYDQVVTKENIEQLIHEDPELDYDIQAAKNPYSRLYKEIRKSKFYSTQTVNKKNEEKMNENTSKPLSSNSVGRQSPLAEANAYMKGSPELLNEMLKYKGGVL